MQCIVVESVFLLQSVCNRNTWITAACLRLCWFQVNTSSRVCGVHEKPDFLLGPWSLPWASAGLWEKYFCGQWCSFEDTVMLFLSFPASFVVPALNTVCLLSSAVKTFGSGQWISQPFAMSKVHRHTCAHTKHKDNFFLSETTQYNYRTKLIPASCCYTCLCQFIHEGLSLR